MSYIGNSPGVASQRVETAFTATSNQTAFTPSSGYTLGYCDVYQNGVKLVNGDDYTASDGVTVTLATGAASGDSIVIVASFPRGLSDGYLKSEADAKYALIASPTFTGVATFAKGTSNGITIGDVSTNSNSVLRLHGTSAGRNWQIANNLNVAGIEFTPSTANGGTTYTTPTVTFLSSGNVGVGTTSPSARLHVSTSGTGIQEVEWLNNAQAVGADVGSAMVFTGTSSNNGLARISGAFSGATTADGAYMAFSTRAVTSGTLTERMRLDASGNLQLGTTSGTQRLNVAGRISFAAVATDADIYGLYVSSDTSNSTTLSSAGATNICFRSNNTERMRLNASGQLGIGTTSPNATLNVRGDNGSSASAVLRLRDTNSTARTTRLQLEDYAGTLADGLIDFKVQTAGVASSAILQLGVNSAAITLDYSGNVGIGGSPSSGKFHVIGDWVSGNATVKAQTVTSVASGGTVGYGTFNNDGTRLGYFYSQSGFTAVGSSSSTPLVFETAGAERARIDTSGRLLVGTTTSYTDYANIQVRGDNKGVAIQDSTDNSYRAIYNQSGTLYFFNGSNEGYLSTAGAWINASDGRLKTNVREIEYGLSTVLATQPRHYERVDIGGTYIGFVAQELQTIIPEVVSGNPEKQLGVDYGSLVAVAFKAIQEQQAIIEQLQADVATLKGTP